ncbi:MAG TPA: CsbD family protein [Myxococcota bacterium]|nr:CsbD family protein [Myxococcota bacterium]
MSGKTDRIKGRAKEAAGALLGDKRLEREGKIERVTGSVKEKAREAVRNIKDKTKEVVNKAKSTFSRSFPIAIE